MIPARIDQLRKIICKVQHNAWKREAGTRSERQAANESDMDIISSLCGALEEALVELEKKGDNN